MSPYITEKPSVFVIIYESYIMHILCCNFWHTLYKNIRWGKNTCMQLLFVWDIITILGKECEITLFLDLGTNGLTCKTSIFILLDSTTLSVYRVTATRSDENPLGFRHSRVDFRRPPLGFRCYQGHSSLPNGRNSTRKKRHSFYSMYRVFTKSQVARITFVANGQFSRDIPQMKARKEIYTLC